MRAITVRQPWAWAIIHGGKDVENRDWAPNVAPGRIAIHAGLTQDEGGYPAIRSILGLDTEGICRVAEAAMCGVIVGAVEVVSTHSRWVGRHECRDTHCAPWGIQSTGHHWVLANPRPCEPIPCRGRLGLWTVPDEIEAAITARRTT